MTKTLTDALPDLRRPFTSAAIKWKIQTNPKPGGKALIVGFMDARLVAERLNSVVGAEWSDAYAQRDDWWVTCRLTVLGSTREDVGWGNLGEAHDKDIGVKTLYSDAFKRAAVKFGIGAYLYAMPKQYIGEQQLKQAGKSWYLTRDAERMLTGGYEAWLKNPETIKRFGEPIDHGDAMDAPEPEPDPHREAVHALRQAYADAHKRGMTQADVGQILDGLKVRKFPELAARIEEAGTAELAEALDFVLDWRPTPAGAAA